MRSDMIGTTLLGQTSGLQRFIPIQNSGDVNNTTEANVTVICPFAFTLNNFRVNQLTGDASFTRTYAVRKNGADTALTCTMATSGTSASDLSNSVAFAQGDTICVGVTAGNTTANTGNIGYSTQMVAGSSNQAMIVSGAGTNVSNSATRWIPFQGNAIGNASGADVIQPIATAGESKNFYLSLAGTPGSGKNYTATLYKNGVATSVVITIADLNTSGSYTATTVSWAQGDTVYWEIVPSGTPTVRTPNFSSEWSPTTDGEMLQCFGNTTSPAAGSVRYAAPMGQSTWTATENTRSAPVSALTARKMYATVATAPGAAKSLTFAPSKNGSTTGMPAAVISGAAATTASDNSTDGSVSAGDILSMSVTPAGTPTVSAAGFAWVSYQAPVVSNTGNFFQMF